MQVPINDGIIRLRQALSSLPLFFVLLDLQYGSGLGNDPGEVDKHLALGKKLLAAGQLADALSHYHAAVDGDPDNYLTYDKRATVYLALGRSKSAVPDLTRVIELKPDFTAARLQRGNVYLKQGRLEETRSDFTAVLQASPGDQNVVKLLVQVAEIQMLVAQAKEGLESSDHSSATDALDQAVELCPWAAWLRELRAECLESRGDLSRAVTELRAAGKLRPEPSTYLRASRLLYSTGELQDALNEVRECLRLDPDHRECFQLYKQAKRLGKQFDDGEKLLESGSYDAAVEKFEASMQTEPSIMTYTIRAKLRICHCHLKNSQVSEAVLVCSEVLKHDPRNVEALCDRAEAHILNDEFGEAVADYERARDIDETRSGVREGLEKAQRLQKLSQRRDYYKILGVKRTAKKQQILKAYRKMAQQWHPDNFMSEEEKKKAEKMFIDIASAKEVLTDPEMRKFDEGEDPLDPENQQGGAGPFQHGWQPFQGFNPFGSGNFHFKFQFN
uniref:dnaJ homolog subfamily C member 3-like n=1 Tax=Myxine glutinosa TaxID=7769 RepID=UPI00358E80AF